MARIEKFLTTAPMASQKQILILMNERLVAEIDAAYPALGYGDRATFIRDAVIQELRRQGINVPVAYKAAPPRIGKAKGGRPKGAAKATVPKAKAG